MLSLFVTYHIEPLTAIHLTTSVKHTIPVAPGTPKAPIAPGTTTGLRTRNRLGPAPLDRKPTLREYKRLSRIIHFCYLSY
jgi:hypothetical protein